MTRPTECRDCTDEIVLARLPNGGWMRLEPYPDPTGSVRVEVLAGGLRVMGKAEPWNRRQKRWSRHKCVPASKAVRRPPQQLVLIHAEEA